MSKELDISQERIENRIFTFRDEQVMLDRDLADIGRLLETFRFQLTDSEKNELVAICDRF